VRRAGAVRRRCSFTNPSYVDARSDIFSLGALLYRFTSGKTPYRGTSVVSILATMATEGLVPLRHLAPDSPVSFCATVERCLAQDKALRFQSVAHLAHALLPYASRRGRVSIEQILAPLGVDLPEDVRSEARQRAELSHPELMPFPLASRASSPSTRPPAESGSRRALSGPASRPPPGLGASRLTALIGLAGLLAILATFLVWRALR
jgi:serine/threonine protein kinase